MANPPQTDKIQIRLRNLGRSYIEGKQQHTVLSNVNADFLQGESTAIRGRSGSGKSTLLNLISGIDAPDTGQVEIAGLNITTMTEHMRTHKKDYASRRGLLNLVSRRRRLLDYLKQIDPQRYLDIIGRLDIRK